MTSPTEINSTLQGISVNIANEAKAVTALGTTVGSTVSSITTALFSTNASTLVSLNAIASAILQVFGPASGSFTLGNATSTVVAQSQVQTNSVALFVPVNATAALTLRTQGLYVSAQTAGVSFTVSTQTGVAIGTESFKYVVYTP